jgi:hypothetical protein
MIPKPSTIDVCRRVLPYESVLWRKRPRKAVAM